MARVVVADNVFDGRGVSLYRASDVAITGNTFVAAMKSAKAVVNAENVLERTVISGNTILRRGVAGPAIGVAHHSGSGPEDVLISNNVIRQATAGGGIEALSPRLVSITGNALSWSVAAPAAAGIVVRPVIRKAEQVVIEGNRLQASTLLDGVFLAASPDSFNAVSVVGNLSRGATHGLRCDNPSLFTEAVVHVGNNWETTPSCSVALVPSAP
ncbi:MAG TPA: hypothetical protein VMU33_08180 [Burkholderiaceae bacterium]|nr:hypothetical protein [Burkholderiaceae bacterium]